MRVSRAGSSRRFAAAVALWLGFACTLSPPARSASAEAKSPAAHWHQWRGPLGTGEAPGADPPITWSEEQNVRWKTAIPGRGHSTPIVWGDRVVVTTAVPYGEPVEPAVEAAHGAHDNHRTTYRHEFQVLALDRGTGEVVWRRTVRRELPGEAGHATSSLASPSPVTDGRAVYAHFGSRGLYALSLATGKPLWSVDLGEMRTKHSHGEGSGPVLWGEVLVVNWDHEGASFVVALDKRTGEERWRAERDEVTSWATPIVVEVDSRPQVVVPGTGRLRGYDLETGRVVWSVGGLSANIVASPVAADGVVYAGSSYDTRAVVAVRLAGARGDLDGTDHVLWRRDRGAPYVPSPLLVDGALYLLQHYQPILWRLDAATGEPREGPARLPGLGNVYASPVAAAGRVYLTDRAGRTLVVRHADPPVVLALNELDDAVSASPAIAGGELFLRGERHLYSLGSPARTRVRPAPAAPPEAKKPPPPTPVEPEPISCASRSAIIPVDSVSEKVGPQRFERVVIVSANDDDCPAERVEAERAREWARRVVESAARDGFEGDLVDWYRWAPVDLGLLGEPTVGRAARLRKARRGFVEGTATAGERTVTFAAVLSLDRKGRPLGVVRSFGGLQADGESRRILRFLTITNLDDDPEWEAVVLDNRYAGASQLVLDPVSTGGLDVVVLRSDGWD